MYYIIHIYIYVFIIYDHHRFKGGHTQNVSYIFQGVFDGGLEHVSFHFEGILKTLPTKNDTCQRPILHLRWGSPKMYLTFWYGPSLKSSLEGVTIYIYYIMYIIYIIYIYIIYIYNIYINIYKYTYIIYICVCPFDLVFSMSRPERNKWLRTCPKIPINAQESPQHGPAWWLQKSNATMASAVAICCRPSHFWRPWAVPPWHDNEYGAQT